jgi:polysaccharide pyruvyl transferase WcaK-like protein
MDPAEQAEPLVGLAPRPLASFPNQKLVHFWCALAEKLQANGYRVIWIPMHPYMDQPLMDEICHSMKVHNKKSRMMSETLLSTFASLDSVIAMRLHAGILSVLHNNPAYMLSYDPKVVAFAKEMDLPYASLDPELSPESVYQGFHAMRLQHYSHARGALEQRCNEMRARAYQNLEHLYSWLNLETPNMLPTFKTPVR